MIDRQSPNYDERRGARIHHLILHYTGMKTGAEALERLCDPEAEVSSHYTVDEDGLIYQHVAEKYRAWHAGASYWQGKTDLNTTSIGIEIVNRGHDWGLPKFKDVQIRSVIELCHDIMVRNDIAPEDVLAHSDIAPARKKDPGEKFPWRDLAMEGIGIWPEPSDEDVVRAAGINIEKALHDFGYDPRVKLSENIVAFQRHYVPEIFATGRAGQVNSTTRKRLYALLAGHLLAPKNRA
jgi:N-acetylmuramoyl-L-alanine amidase